jgi:hypothetical protein
MSIIINPDSLSLIVGGFPIRDFPASGAILSIARGQAPVTYVPSYGRDAFVVGPGWWNIGITVEAASESDNWFESALRAFLTIKKVISASGTRSGVPLFSSPSTAITTVPDIVYNADGLPMRTWVLTGKCTTEPTAGVYVAAETLTVEEIQNA